MPTDYKAGLGSVTADVKGGYGGVLDRPNIHGGKGPNQIYLPQKGESHEAWQNRLRSLAGTGDQMAQTIVKKGSQDPEFMNNLFKTGDLSSVWSSQESSQARVDRSLREFYDRMNAPLDVNDPEVRSAMAIGRNSAQRSAAGRGVSGGLSDAGVAKGAMDATIPIIGQRREMGLKALAMSGDRQQYVDAMARNAEMRNEDLTRRDSQETWNRNEAEQQKWLGIATGAFGAGTSAIGGAASMGGLSGENTRPSGLAGATGPSNGYNNINISNGSASLMRPNSDPSKGY